MNEDMIEIIHQAALLHDVGKIGIPESVLNKAGSLTDEEYEMIKGHVEASIDIIRHLPSLDYVIPGRSSVIMETPMTGKDIRAVLQAKIYR